MEEQCAKELAETVVKTIDESENNFDFLYPDDMPLWEKNETIAKKIYGASSISAPANVKKQIDDLQANGYGSFPVCVAKRLNILFRQIHQNEGRHQS